MQFNEQMEYNTISQILTDLGFVTFGSWFDIVLLYQRVKKKIKLTIYFLTLLNNEECWLKGGSPLLYNLIHLSSLFL
jgi:hypothetical protein